LILYLNGDSHSAGAEAVNSYCFAEDDSQCWRLGRRPHPDNEKVSFGFRLAEEIGATLYNDSESASSNSRIIRTTEKYLEKNKPDFILIGWSTWEREEWLFDNIHWQVNAGGVGHDWPDQIKEKYKNYIVSLDWNSVTNLAHSSIYDFHCKLLDYKIPHLFFNTYNNFSGQSKKSWDGMYIDPYDPDMTYYKWLTNKGFKSKPTYHFGPDGHAKWAEFLLPHLTRLL